MKKLLALIALLIPVHAFADGLSGPILLPLANTWPLMQSFSGGVGAAGGVTVTGGATADNFAQFEVGGTMNCGAATCTSIYDKATIAPTSGTPSGINGDLLNITYDGCATCSSLINLSGNSVIMKIAPTWAGINPIPFAIHYNPGPLTNTGSVPVVQNVLYGSPSGDWCGQAGTTLTNAQCISLAVTGPTTIPGVNGTISEYDTFLTVPNASPSASGSTVNAEAIHIQGACGTASGGAALNCFAINDTSTAPVFFGGPTTVSNALTVNLAALSAPSWTQLGLFSIPGGTVTDMTATGTVTTEAGVGSGMLTLNSTSPATFTNWATMYLANPACTDKATCTNLWSLFAAGAIRAGGVTSSGGVVNLNTVSNFAVNIASSSNTAAVTIGNSSNTTTIGSPLGFSGPQSAASWGVGGINMLGGSTITDTDTTASGTVTTETGFAFPNVNIAATNAATTITNLADLYLPSPTAGSNVTASNIWSLFTGGGIRSGGPLVGVMGLTVSGGNIALDTASNFTVSIASSSNTSAVTIGNTADTTNLQSTTLKLNNLATSSTAQTGTVCSGAGGLLTVDTTTTCLLSLEELKDKHGDIGGDVALKDIMSMKPFWMTWKTWTPEWKGGDHAVQPALGAHQVEGVDKRISAYGGDGKLRGVRYQELTAVLVAAMQKEQTEIAALKAANDGLTHRIAKLERRK